MDRGQQLARYRQSTLVTITLPITHRRILNRGFYFAGVGGLLLGLSVFAHPTSLVILPGFLVYSFVEMRRKNMGNFFFLVAVLLVVLFFAGVVNYVRFNSFTEFGYGYYGSLAAHNGWTGLVGLLVSPGGSLFLYFPISLLLPWAAKGMVDQKKKRLLYLFVFIIVINWLDVGTLSLRSQTLGGEMAGDPDTLSSCCPS